MLGGMARAYIEAFCAVRDIERATVYSPAKRERSASAPSGEPGIEVAAVDAVRDAAEGADIQASAAAAFDADRLEADRQVTNLGSDETSRQAPGRIDVKVRQGDAGRGNGRRSAPEERGRGAPAESIAGAEEEVMRLRPWGGSGSPDYCDPVVGKALGGTSDFRTAFHVGFQVLQFVAADCLVYRMARSLGTGRGDGAAFVGGPRLTGAMR